MTANRPEKKRGRKRGAGRGGAGRKTAGGGAGAAQDSASGERVAKRLARSGMGSRRQVEGWIAEGRVAVNGATLTGPAVNVTAADKLTLDGRDVPAPEPSRLWRYHKPAGVVVAGSDEHGRPTIYDRLPADLPRVMPVGRLDVNSEGLLLLTNDGGLKRHLELPATGLVRRYRVRVRGQPNEATLQRLHRGLTVEGESFGPIEAVVDSRTRSNSWLTVTLREGKNREVRRALEAVELPVNRLIRVAYGPLQLGKLARDQASEVRPKVLKEQFPQALSSG